MVASVCNKPHNRNVRPIIYYEYQLSFSDTFHIIGDLGFSFRLLDI